jgi:hypothetical protein
MANKATFHPYGITLNLPDGDVILNAGSNMTIFPQGKLITFAAQIPTNLVINGLTAWQPPMMADSVAIANSVYFSTTNNKLSYKDSSNAVHALY